MVFLLRWWDRAVGEAGGDIVETFKSSRVMVRAWRGGCEGGGLRCELS